LQTPFSMSIDGRTPGGDGIGDPGRVATYSVDLFRRHRVEELETQEVEPGLVLDNPTVVFGLAVLDDGEVSQLRPRSRR